MEPAPEGKGAGKGRGKTPSRAAATPPPPAKRGTVGSAAKSDGKSAAKSSGKNPAKSAMKSAAGGEQSALAGKGRGGKGRGVEDGEESEVSDDSLLLSDSSATSSPLSSEGEDSDVEAEDGARPSGEWSCGRVRVHGIECVHVHAHVHVCWLCVRGVSHPVYLGPTHPGC